MSQELAMEIGVHLFLFSAVVYLVLTFLGKFSEAAVDLREAQSADALDNSLAEIYATMSPEMFRLLRWTSAAICFLLGYLGFDLLAGIFLGLIGYAVPALMLQRIRRKRVLMVEQQLVDGLELLKNGLKSGLTMQQSAELLVKEFPPPVSQEFALVLAEVRLGVDFIDGLQNMATRLDSSIVQILASGVAVTKKCGGDIGEIFGALADTIREQAKIEGKLQAVTAQGRFQGLILGAMPFLLLFALYFIDRTHVVTLFSNQIGIYAFCGVVVMVLIAQLWIRKMMDIDV